MHNENSIGDNPHEALAAVQQTFTPDVLTEIATAFAKAKMTPTVETITAFADALSGSNNEVRRFIAKVAERHDSTLFSEFLR